MPNNPCQCHPWNILLYLCKSMHIPVITCEAHLEMKLTEHRCNCLCKRWQGTALPACYLPVYIRNEQRWLKFTVHAQKQYIIVSAQVAWLNYMRIGPYEYAGPPIVHYKADAFFARVFVTECRPHGFRYCLVVRYQAGPTWTNTHLGWTGHWSKKHSWKSPIAAPNTGTGLILGLRPANERRR